MSNSLFNKRSFKNISSITLANAVNNIVSFSANVLAARHLGTENFGVFSLAITIVLILNIFGDLGLNLSMIRLHNKFTDSVNQNLIIQTSFIWRLLLFLVISILSYPLSLITIKFSNLNCCQSILNTAFITGGLMLLWSFFLSHYQLNFKFYNMAILISIYSLLRIFFMSIVLILAPNNLFYWFCALYFLPLLVLVFLMKNKNLKVNLKEFIKKIRTYKLIFIEILKYSKWVAISSVFYAFLLNIIRFLMAFFTDIHQVGIFSAGITFSLAFSMLNTSIRTVLFPKITSFKHSEQIKDFLSHIRKALPYYVFLSALIIIIMGIAYYYFLGAEYRKGILVFFITSSAIAITMYLGLINILLHTLMKPQIDAFVNIFRFFLMVFLSLFLIPKYLAVGAAISYGISLLLGEIWMTVYVIRKVKQECIM